VGRDAVGRRERMNWAQVHKLKPGDRVTFNQRFLLSCDGGIIPDGAGATFVGTERIPVEEFEDYDDDDDGKSYLCCIVAVDDDVRDADHHSHPDTRLDDWAYEEVRLRYPGIIRRAEVAL
jgi:hypothetical protein